MNIDAKEFERIYDEFARKIYIYCYFRVNSQEAAEDLAASVFMRAWDHIVGGKNVDKVQAFLYRIASNLIIDYYRKGTARREVTIDDPLHPIDIHDETDLSGSMDKKFQLQDVRRALADMPDQYREVMILKYFNELSIKEIAEILETQENTISVRLHRALDKIKKILA